MVGALFFGKIHIWWSFFGSMTCLFGKNIVCPFYEKYNFLSNEFHHHWLWSLGKYILSLFTPSTL